MKRARVLLVFLGPLLNMLNNAALCHDDCVALYGLLAVAICNEGQLAACIAVEASYGETGCTPPNCVTCQMCVNQRSVKICVVDQVR